MGLLRLRKRQDRKPEGTSDRIIDKSDVYDGVRRASIRYRPDRSGRASPGVFKINCAGVSSVRGNECISNSPEAFGGFLKDHVPEVCKVLNGRDPVIGKLAA